MEQADCPSRETLHRLLADELSGAEEELIDRHLAECSNCQHALDKLSDGPELRDASSTNSPWANATPHSDEPGLSSVIKKLGQSPLVDATEGLDSPAQPPLFFLTPSGDADSLGFIDDYRVLSELGRGGMGVVLKAEDQELGRIVAIKVLWPDPSDVTARERFVREARTAAGIRHDNVVTVHKAEMPADGPPFLVMEFVDGITLSKRIDRKLFNAEEAAQICIDVANGLTAAHKVGLVHRDVKPSNIILDSATQQAKIVDFGLARAATVPGDLTREGQRR